MLNLNGFIMVSLEQFIFPISKQPTLLYIILPVYWF